MGKTLDAMSIKELRAVAKREGLKGYSRLNREYLFDMLSEHFEKKNPPAKSRLTVAALKAEEISTIDMVFSNYYRDKERNGHHPDPRVLPIWDKLSPKHSVKFLKLK